MMAERLASAHPGNAQYQRNLAFIRQRLAALTETDERP
jgi:hypothetical protein